uniref:Histone-lysine N-methyltransferase SETMAR-like isoform X2 n=1 Tax=Petromyzon marinus TaxID=7757 RepID=A0AAJ7U089_PETMA|nr:histone-lysine N-methyltransferase SETMAR-like isoform X2 [Petromyzon marinus]
MSVAFALQHTGVVEMSRGACTDVAQGLESLPIELTNGVDDEMPPCIQYTPDYVRGPGCAVDPGELTLPGCECADGRCDASPVACPCLRGGGDGAACYDPAGRLVGDAGFARPIFECNPLCRCGDACPSRVVQKGLAVRLQVFRTARKGWAVRTLEPLGRGRFVCEYVGEVLGGAEARRRAARQASGSDGRAINYLIAVREHAGDGRGVAPATSTYVDPERVGNVGRFLNHSCEPNLVMALVRVHSVLPRLALFAARDIADGEELCYDYSGEFLNPHAAAEACGPSWRPERDGGRETGADAGDDGDGAPGGDRGGREDSSAVCASPDGDGVAGQRKPCFCGAPSCRGVLPFDPTLFADER